MSELDLARIAKLLGVAGGSHHDGEAVNAIRVVDRMLREAGMRWPDLTNGHQQAEIATEAAAILLRDLTSAQRRIAELEAERGTTPLPVVWNDVGDPCKQAQWCLDEHAARRLYLNEFEFKFLGAVAGWYGALTENQQPVFERIMAAVTKRSRRRPPS
jgi:hypothetical protein